MSKSQQMDNQSVELSNIKPSLSIEGKKLTKKQKKQLQKQQDEKMVTLQQGYDVKKSPHSRQFQAVLVKDLCLTIVQPCAIIFCLIVTIALVAIMGGLHIYYVKNHTTVNTNQSASTPVDMPLEGSPSNINHRMQFTLPANSSDIIKKYFGELPQNTTGSGYLGAADKQYDNNNGPQTRQPIQYTNATYDVEGTYLYIPFSDNATSMSHMWCDPENLDENCTINFMTYDDFDQYENQTAYNLMYQNIDAQKDETGEAEAQFQYREHADLYTSGVNFSYFSTAYNKFFEKQPTEIGWDYVISTYTSHQTQLGYNLTNFFHVGGTQYWLWLIFLRNNFQAQNSSLPLVQGQYKYFWQNYDDEGTDPYTPIYSCLFIPLAFYIVIALLSYNMSAEKSEGQQAIQQMMGLRFWYRYFGDLVFNLIIAAIVTLIIFIILIACNTEYITTTYPLITFLWMFLFLLNIPMLSHLFAAFTDSPRAVSIISLLYVVVISFVGLIAFAGPLFDSSITNRYVDYAYALIPGMGPIVMLVDIAALVTLQDPNYYLSTENGFYFSISKNADNSILANTGYQCACACFIGYLTILIYGLIAIYVDKISPRKNGIPEHWLFMFQHLYEQSCYYNKERISELSNRKVAHALATFFKHPSIIQISQKEIDHYITVNQENYAKNAANSSEATSTTDIQTTLSTQQLSTNPETSTTVPSSKVNTQLKEQKQFMKQGFRSNSPDLVKEKQNCIQNITCTGGVPLINIINLQKTFKTRLGVKHAVRGLYYTVGENELLVLLGPNGCGKTTHINIISGLFRATSGNAFVCGQSILQSSSQKNFADRIGICPQFDIIYPKLTVMQHMQFYARMKGVSPDIQQQHIRELLFSVGLYDQMNQKAGTLSGGMKRRLSIAISLINKPKIVILDEPSSGLDVATRRAVWSIILRYKQDRAIILTTHAMEEAEALATRVGIMSDGKLLAIDTVSNLKNRFSGGYQLIINCRQLKEQNGIQQEGKIQLTYEGEQIVNSLIKQAFNTQMSLVQCYQGNLTYVVSKQAQISKVFEIMEQMCQDESTNIADYALNQASLESIFMKVVRNSEGN